jgi:hypothetical protein
MKTMGFPHITIDNSRHATSELLKGCGLGIEITCGFFACRRTDFTW